MFAIAMAAFTFTSCEDVPAPYDIPEDGGGDTPEVIQPAGSGTLEDPYNVAGALEYVNSLEADVNSETNIYIKGVVSVIEENFNETGTFGNARFYISDDTDMQNQFYCYRTMYLGNTKYTSGTVLEAGDTVVVCGKVVNYSGNTPETVASQAYVYSINGETGEQGSGDEGLPEGAEGDGTLENPYNAIAAYYYTSKMEASVNSEESFYIKGIVSQIDDQFSAQHGNASYYISADGTFDSKDSGNQFYIFRSLYLNNEKYTEGDLLQVGDEVVVYGKVVNYYGNTPETVQGQSYLYSWTQNGGVEDEVIGDLTTLNGDFEAWINGQPNNWKSESSASNATISMSTDAHSGNYSVLVEGNSKGNKRISYKEIELEPGEYTMTFYAKAATEEDASACPGFVKVTDGSVGNYNYGSYTNDITNAEWIQITHTFTIDEKGTYCVLIMNPKKPGKDLLIDDFTLTCGSNTIIK